MKQSVIAILPQVRHSFVYEKDILEFSRPTNKWLGKLVLFLESKKIVRQRRITVTDSSYRKIEIRPEDIYGQITKAQSAFMQELGGDSVALLGTKYFAILRGEMLKNLPVTWTTANPYEGRQIAMTGFGLVVCLPYIEGVVIIPKRELREILSEIL